MRQIICLSCWLALCGATVAQAQEFSLDRPVAAPQRQDSDVPPASAGSMSPETWLYLQEYRRQNSPRALIQRRAQEEALQRRQRLSAMAWYGLSNIRPVAHPTPWTASYSPAWVASSWNPYSWVGIGAYPRVLQIDDHP